MCSSRSSICLDSSRSTRKIRFAWRRTDSRNDSTISKARRRPPGEQSASCHSVKWIAFGKKPKPAAKLRRSRRRRPRRRTALRKQAMSDSKGPYEEGKRAGLHPLVVIFGALIGLWLFVALIVPSSKNKQATGTEGPNVPLIEDPEAAPVLFRVEATVPDMNVISLVVPPQATDSQVVGLLKRLRKERLEGT